MKGPAEVTNLQLFSSEMHLTPKHTNITLHTLYKCTLRICEGTDCWHFAAITAKTDECCQPSASFTSLYQAYQQDCATPLTLYCSANRLMPYNSNHSELIMICTVRTNRKCNIIIAASFKTSMHRVPIKQCVLATAH